MTIGLPSRWLTWIGIVTMTGGLCGIMGCNEPFEPGWRVQSYRMLALRSEPAAIQPGEAARLSVLDSPTPNREVDYQWEWCPVPTSARNEYQCPLDQFRDQLDDGGNDAPPIPDDLLSLGSGPTARLPYPGSRDQVEQLCTRLQKTLADVSSSSPISDLAPETDCSRQYEVSVRLVARLGDGDKRVARKTVVLGTGSDELNANPGHDGIEIRLADRSKADRVRDRLDWVAPEGADDENRWFPIARTGQTPVLAGLRYQVRADVDSRTLETWRPPAPAGSERERLDPETETWVFEWYTSDGRLTRSEQIFSRQDVSTIGKAARTALEIPTTFGTGCPAATTEPTALEPVEQDASPIGETASDAVDAGAPPDGDAVTSDTSDPSDVAEETSPDGSTSRDTSRDTQVGGDTERANPRDVGSDDVSSPVDATADGETSSPEADPGRDVSERSDTSREPGATVEPSCRLYLWSLIRDERLGVDWAERRLRVIGRVD